MGNDTVSDWIGPGYPAGSADPGLQYGSPAGSGSGNAPYYDFQTQFYNTGGTYSITGQWAAANWGQDILLDGLSTGNAIALPGANNVGNPSDWWDSEQGFFVLTPFTITPSTAAQLATGWHTLDFVTYESATYPYYSAMLT